MKRTDMINKLRDIILTHINCGPDCCGDDPQMYDTMLKEIEALGMKPPILDEDKCQALMCVYYGGYTFYQWDEDFEKDTKAVAALTKRKINEQSNS